MATDTFPVSIYFKVNNVLFAGKDETLDPIISISANNSIYKENRVQIVYYPNRITVNIEKTSFLAVTSKDNKKFYIGSNGKLISIKNSESFEKSLAIVQNL